jgi:hypothetical protein
MRTQLIGILWKHRWLTFLLMGVFFLLFGAMTVNIFVPLKANIDLYLDYGTMVIADGALLQLAARARGVGPYARSVGGSRVASRRSGRLARSHATPSDQGGGRSSSASAT